jgi:hypothetical protein
MQTRTKQKNTLALSTTYFMVTKKCQNIIIRLPKCLSLPYLTKYTLKNCFFWWISSVSHFTFSLFLAGHLTFLSSLLACLESDLFSLCLGSYIQLQPTQTTTMWTIQHYTDYTIRKVASKLKIDGRVRDIEVSPLAHPPYHTT